MIQFFEGNIVLSHVKKEIKYIHICVAANISMNSRIIYQTNKLQKKLPSKLSIIVCCECDKPFPRNESLKAKCYFYD